MRETSTGSRCERRPRLTEVVLALGERCRCSAASKRPRVGNRSSHRRTFRRPCRRTVPADGVGARRSQRSHRPSRRGSQLGAGHTANHSRSKWLCAVHRPEGRRTGPGRSRWRATGVGEAIDHTVGLSEVVGLGERVNRTGPSQSSTLEPNPTPRTAANAVRAAYVIGELAATDRRRRRGTRRGLTRYRGWRPFEASSFPIAEVRHAARER